MAAQSGVREQRLAGRRLPIQQVAPERIYVLVIGRSVRKRPADTVLTGAGESGSEPISALSLSADVPLEQLTDAVDRMRARIPRRYASGSMPSTFAVPIGV